MCTGFFLGIYDIRVISKGEEMFENIKRKKGIEIKEGDRLLVRNWDDTVSEIVIFHVDEPKDLVVEMDKNGELLRGSLAVLSHEIIRRIKNGGN